MKKKRESNQPDSPLGVRMDDVAQRANVSRATVSRVLRGSPPVSEHTRERVHQALRDSGYVPNAMARSLATRNTGLIGLLLRDPRNPAYGLLHSEIQGAASEQNLQLITAVPYWTEGAEQELDSLNRMLGLRVSGLFVATGVIKAADVEPFLDAVPVVSVGRIEDHPRINAVSYAEDTHGVMLANAVADAGHTSVGIVVPEVKISTGENLRAISMARHLRSRGVRVYDLPTDDLLSPLAQADSLIELVQEQKITAAMFPSDRRALAFCSYARDRGLKVPDDVSVTGCDGIIPGLELTGLTSLRLPVEEVTRRAVTRMTELLAAPGESDVRHEKAVGTLVPGATLAAV